MIITDQHCQSCGACCQTVLGVSVGFWAACTASDVKQMPKRVRLKLVPTRTGSQRGLATPQRKDGSCGFLRGTPGERVSCAIYDTRPMLCRKYEAGSEFCRSSRREIGLPA